MKLNFRFSHEGRAVRSGGPQTLAAPLALTLTLFVGVSTNAVTPGKLNLNRTATKLTTTQLSAFHGAHTGFRWNSGDNGTLYWRPQGIAGYTEGNSKYLIVSWAGQPTGGYDDSRGARISVVDVTSMNSIKYRHVLLVTQGKDVFPKLHAGGITVRNGTLHVADSRPGKNQILTFDLSKFEEVSKLGYRYILRQIGDYPSPVKPSFLSFDWSRNQFLVGSFTDKSAHNLGAETTSTSAKLAWYSSPSTAAQAIPQAPFYRQMQGAGADGEYLWTTHSYGRSNESHLHVHCYRSAQSIGYEQRWTYPPGLEDVHVSLSSDNIWMLTEFGNNEGSGNNRDVFATKRSRLMPSAGCN